MYKSKGEKKKSKKRVNVLFQALGKLYLFSLRKANSVQF